MRTRDRWKGSEETEETNNYKIKGKEINNKNIRERRDLKRKKEYINKVKKEKKESIFTVSDRNALRLLASATLCRHRPPRVFFTGLLWLPQ